MTWTSSLNLTAWPVRSGGSSSSLLSSPLRRDWRLADMVEAVRKARLNKLRLRLAVARMISPLFTLLLLALCAAAQQVPPASVASSFSLPTSTSFPFPSATQAEDDTESFIVAQWSLSKGRIQNNAQNLAFVDDPFPNNPPPVPDSSNHTGPVLQVTYPQDSFSDSSGGAQFINLWNASDGSSFNSMLLSYEVAFNANFDWVKGGKLPGLRGGLATSGCSGGSKSDGTACFSSRVMWRQNGAGEGTPVVPA